MPDIGASFATVSSHTSHVASCPPAPPLRSRRIFRHGGEWGVQEGEIGRVNYLAAQPAEEIVRSGMSVAESPVVSVIGPIEQL